LESLQEEVREAATKSRSASLNEICSSLSWIHDRVNTVRESAAYERLEKRAEQGDALAQYELGIAFRDGQHGIQDYEEAYYWLYLAVTANLATKDVGAEAVTCTRDDTASHLTPADLSRVQGRAREWVKNHLADLSFDDPRRGLFLPNASKRQK
jgi:TPR repeat protein